MALLCVTGGPAVVKAAAQSGKRVIAGGPGNPPVVVDEDADLDLAARSIIEGAAFDNNLLCIGEKEVFVVERVADDFITAMARAGAVKLDAPAIKKLTEAAFTFDGPGKGCGRAHVKRNLLGQDAGTLAEAAGMRVPAGTVMLFGETAASHPFVQEEQMMPFLPIVRVPDFSAGVAAALQAEHGYRHTAIVHTRNVEHATAMARALNTTLFVQNAPSTAALGVNGPGYFSHTIATPTGEGVTTPLTFTRERQFAIGGAMRFICRSRDVPGPHRRHADGLTEGPSPGGRAVPDLAASRRRRPLDWRAARGPRPHGRGPRLDRAGLLRRDHRARLAWQRRSRPPRRGGDCRPGGTAAGARRSGVMRLGIVVGRVVLSRSLPALQGTSLLLVEPVTAANLAARNGQGGGKTLVVADQLSPATGEMIGIVEGSEAANPYPAPTPVDAYCALIVNDFTFQPPETADRPASEGRG